MTSDQPVGFGVVGVVNFADAVLQTLQAGSAASDRPLRVVAAVGHDPQRNAAPIEALRAKGIDVVTTLDELLSRQDIEAVWLPVPIHLHRPFTERALAAGKAVVCEKPVAGSIADLDAMLAAQRRYNLPVAIGYQDLCQPATLAAKRLLHQGKIGSVRSATLIGCWPRADAYFNRSDWPGKLRVGDTWVLDSPANNALAHYINLVLFLLGAADDRSAEPLAVEAELYRVNPIENYDTCGLRVTLRDDVTFTVLLTHACQRTVGPIIRINGDQGSLSYSSAEMVFHDASGQPTLTLPRLAGQAWSEHYCRRIARYVRGVADDSSVVATLQTSRPHLMVINGASEAAVVHDVDPSVVRVVTNDKGHRLTTIVGIEELFERCAQQRCLPHESGLASWTVAAGVTDLRNYHSFAGARLGAGSR
jgi:predicted dehydrogenase